jgi:hypothetical protein
MGLEITLQDERGQNLETVSDPKNLLHHLLEPFQGKELVLTEIDWYGDTTFNHLQIPRFLSGWHSVTQSAKTPEEVTLLDHVARLALRCKNGEHLYLKFIGD